MVTFFLKKSYKSLSKEKAIPPFKKMTWFEVGADKLAIKWQGAGPIGGGG